MTYVDETFLRNVATYGGGAVIAPVLITLVALVHTMAAMVVFVMVCRATVHPAMVFLATVLLVMDLLIHIFTIFCPRHTLRGKTMAHYLSLKTPKFLPTPAKWTAAFKPLSRSRS